MGVKAEQKGGRVIKSGANRYRYDACGRLAEKILHRHGFRPQRWQYRWNSDNRLTDLYTPSNEHWRYEYDAFGRRLRKFNLTQSNLSYANDARHSVGEEYLWSGEQLLEAAPIYADGTVAFEHATRWSYAPGGITPLAQQQGDKLWYVVTDHLGTPRELLDESGQLGWSNSPQVWGQARLWQAANDEFSSANVIPINKTTCPIRFPGQYYDEESGLHYNRHRYYDPETAQYLSPDPLGLGGGTRPQGYVDNPLSWVDPLGLATCPITKLEERGFTGVEVTKNGGLDYAASDALYSKNGVNPIQKIEYTGNYHKDFEQANMATLGQKSTPKGYVWHHLDDYDSGTNTGTMQLVKQKAHSGIPHIGGVSQYKEKTGISYIFKTW